MSGVALERFSLVTATICSLPALCGATTGGMPTMPIGTCPPRSAATGDMHDEHAGELLKRFAGEVHRAARSRRAVGKLAGILLRIGDQLLDRLHGQRWMHRDRERRVADHGDRREILFPVVVHLQA